MSFLHREAVLLPGLQTAVQAVDLLEADARQCSGRRPTAAAGRTIGDDGPRCHFRELRSAAAELGQRNVDGIRQASAFVFLRLTHVEEDRVLPIDEPSYLR